MRLLHALAAGALLWSAAPARAAEPIPPGSGDHRQHAEDLAELRRWEAMAARLAKARDARDARELAAIDQAMTAELAAERREADEEVRRVREDIRRDGRAEPGARRAVPEPHHERADRARLEAISAEWGGLRGRYGAAEVARRRALLDQLLEQARREVEGGKAAPEEGPGSDR